MSAALANDLGNGFEILWYKIDSVLGRGGFGITYLAMDNNLDQLVAIKEYLPHEFAARSGDSTVQPVSVEQEDVYSWGLERFMSEAQTLAKFKHPHIVRVLSVFKHNNTGYMVMEYEQGKDLSDVYKEKKKLTQRELEDIYYPIIDGLSAVHKEGFIHRDIKPSNIYIRTDGSPVLIDFGAARQAVGSKTKTLTSMLSIGYAPFEQYNDEPGKQGAWTDIYALGASLHQGITGAKPMESTIRGMALLHDEPDPYEPLSQSGIEGYSQFFLRAIDQALMLQIHDRPQTLEDFLGMLKGEITLPDLPSPDEKVAESTQVRDRTVVRPVKRKFSGAGVEGTQPDLALKNKAAATGTEDSTDITETEVMGQRPQSARSPKQGLLTQPKFLLAIGGIIAIVIAVVIYLPREPSPGDIQQQKVEALLEQADELITSGNYSDDTGTGALSAYQKILAIDPDNSAAKNGVDNVVRHYLLQAEQYIDKNDFARADDSLKIVNSIAPEFPGLKETLARYSSNFNNEKKFKQIEMVIGLANTALEQGRIYEPDKKNALFYYENVLKLDPENVTAKLGLFQIADTLVDQAKAALNKNNTQKADKLASLAESINPDKSTIKALRQQIGKTRQLDKVLAKADSAFKRSRYTTPQKDNAYELYKQVLAMAPSNRHAQRRLNEIADYYGNRTRRSTQSGDLTSAKASLGILEKFFPNNADISNLRGGIINKQSEIEKQKQKKTVIAKTEKKKQKPSNDLLPIGVNQKLDDYQVVQDIVGLFINSFKNRNMHDLLKVSQLTSQQRGLYTNIFGVYHSLNIKVVPNSFTLIKKDGVARIKFEIIDLIDANGNMVVTSANWTKFEIEITKKNGGWLKAKIS